MRPDWNQNHMASAFIASFRSHDTQSKVGAVLVNKEKKEISRGYNGFCAEIDESDLPTTRPAKYPLMVHAEENAVSNLVVKPEFATLYATRMPCCKCSKLLWQNNVREWYVPRACIEPFEGVNSQDKIKAYTQDDEIVFNLLLRNGLIVHYLDFTFDTLQEIVNSNSQYFSYLD